MVLGWRGATSATALRGRAAERQILDQALRRARGGESAVLILRGAAGVGKTALLDYLAGSASGCRLIRIAGVESELELSLAAVHQLCSPMLDLLESLPEPQATDVAGGLPRRDREHA